MAAGSGALALLIFGSLVACGTDPVTSPVAPAATSALSLDDLARGYVMAVLRLDRIRAGTNDYDYGPPEWKAAVLAEPMPVPAALREEVRRLAAGLEARARAGVDAAPPAAAADAALLDHERLLWLQAQVAALDTHLGLILGERLSVRDQVDRLFQLEARYVPEQELAEARRTLDGLLPGGGDLPARIAAFRNSFAVPRDKVEAVYRFALEEVRRRTLEFLPLPAAEGLELAFVTGQPWGGYNWFQGQARSRIDINLDLPVLATSVYGYIAHEAYPGHHTELAVREARLYRERGWVEWCVSPLFTPKNAISEAIAEVGTEILFTPEARFAWMRDALWPRFGLPGDLDLWRRAEPALEVLAEARTNGTILLHDRGQTDAEVTAYLVREQGLDTERAAKSVAFDRAWGVYAFNYRAGRAVVRRWVEAAGPDLAARRERFVRLLTHPVTPRLIAEWGRRDGAASR